MSLYDTLKPLNKIDRLKVLGDKISITHLKDLPYADGYGEFIRSLLFHNIGWCNKIRCELKKDESLFLDVLELSEYTYIAKGVLFYTCADLLVDHPYSIDVNTLDNFNLSLLVMGDSAMRGRSLTIDSDIACSPVPISAKTLIDTEQWVDIVRKGSLSAFTLSLIGLNVPSDKALVRETLLEHGSYLAKNSFLRRGDISITPSEYNIILSDLSGVQSLANRSDFNPDSSNLNCLSHAVANFHYALPDETHAKLKIFHERLLLVEATKSSASFSKPLSMAL